MIQIREFKERTEAKTLNPKRDLAPNNWTGFALLKTGSDAGHTTIISSVEGGIQSPHVVQAYPSIYERTIVRCF